MALIFLTDEQNDRLDQLARTTGKSRAELEQELLSGIDSWMADIESGKRLSRQEAMRDEMPVAPSWIYGVFIVLQALVVAVMVIYM